METYQLSATKSTMVNSGHHILIRVPFAVLLLVPYTGSSHDAPLRLIDLRGQASIKTRVTKQVQLLFFGCCLLGIGREVVKIPMNGMFDHHQRTLH